MVGSVGDVSEEIPRPIVNRGDDRDVGQVRPAKARMIGNDDVTGFKGQGRRDFSDAKSEGTEMNGHVRSVGREEAIGVKQSAGEVEALLDVGRKGGALKASPHFLDKRKETIGKQFASGNSSEVGGIWLRHFAHGNLFEQKAATIPYPSTPTRL